MMTSAAAAASIHQAEWCDRLANRLPGISSAKCRSSELAPTGATSFKGFPILARQIPSENQPGDGYRPVRVLLMGGIHGDELTSSSIVFKWLQFIQSQQARKFHWNVIPVLNPDGLLGPRPNRVNANGVDLNRNFPTPNWHRDAPRYWVRRTGSDPRRYPGKAPLSEPESRWLDDEMERFKPQVIISVHAPFGVLDFDGPAEPPRRFGRLVLNRVGVYPGSLGNYSGMHKNVPVITIELPNARAMPSDTEVRRIWQDMLAWIERNVPREQEPIAVPATAASPSADRNGAALLDSRDSPSQDTEPGAWNRMSDWIRRYVFRNTSP
jgi:protein MpaA